MLPNSGFLGFIKRWGSMDAIRAEAGVFCKDAEAVFGALIHRIQRENTEFYLAMEAM